MQTSRTVDLNKFKNAVGITASFSMWGNTRKADLGKMLKEGKPGPFADLQSASAEARAATTEEEKQAAVDRSRFRMSKQLVRADEYEAIKTAMGEMRAWLYARTVPSFFKSGFQLATVGAVQEIEEQLNAFNTVRLPLLVAELQAVWDAKIEDAKKALGEQFNPRDYPMAEELPDLFRVEHYWIAFTTPEGLPPELRQQEEEKLQRKFADAGEQIVEALRAAFLDLISHATEKLTVEEGAKPRVFRDSLVSNINDFISTFNSRNLMNDAELAGMVEKAKAILGTTDAETLRKKSDLRASIANQFGQIKSALDGMVTVKKGRKFDLGE